MPVQVEFPPNVAELLKTYDPEEHDIIVIIGRPTDSKMDMVMDVPDADVAVSLLREAAQHVEDTPHGDEPQSIN